MSAYEFVGYFDGDYVGLELGAFLVLLDFQNFVLHFDAEYPLDNEHGKNNAYHTERISRGIARGHYIGLFGSGRHGGDGLLCGCQTGRVGHSTAHHTNQSTDIVYIAEVVNAKHYQHVECYTGHSKHVEPYSSLLE